MTGTGPLVLVVDDNERLLALVQSVLSKQGFRVETAPTLFRAQGVLARLTPDLVILDRQLPDGDGIDLCVKMRADRKNGDVRVIFLTARKSTADRISGLESGGDDYLVKPFSSKELVLRVRAILRRPPSSVARQMLMAGPFAMDVEAVRASADGRDLELARKEFELLRVFLESPHRTLSRESLLQRVWGADKAATVTANVVEVTVGNLKRKLGPLASKIATVRGFGYRLDV